MMQQALEIVLIAAIIAAQCYFFWITLRKVRVLQSVFAPAADYRITRLTLRRQDLEKIPPQQILANLSKYQVKQEPGVADTDETVSLGLIAQLSGNPVSDAIHHSINTYLLRNSGVVPDFNLIKDIADRNSEAVEEEIASTISIPLYLGLLGTLLGIIFGLFNISNLSFADTGLARNVMLDLTIPALLGGVKIAMIASFIGLLLTVIHSGFLFKKAKAINVLHKHGFFNFIQVELLPILNKNLNETLYSLQTNLLLFNKDFTHNIHRLDGLMNKNYDALIAQENVIEMLSKMDITEFATANVQTLAQLQTAIKNFGEFNQYVGSVNFAIQKTDNVIARINDLLGRTEGVENVTQRVLSVFEMNHELMRFLKSHFNSLDNSKQMIAQSVVDVNEQLSTALDELRKFTAEKVTAIKNIEIEHVDLMNKSFAERTKKQEDPKELGQIIRMLNDNGNANSAQIATLNNTLEEVRNAITKLDRNIRVQVRMPTAKEIVKSWFKKETPKDEEIEA
jgi:prefoldin subunit 5